MAQGACYYCCYIFLRLLIVGSLSICSSEASLSWKGHGQRELKREQRQLFLSSLRQIFYSLPQKTAQHDETYPPNYSLSTTPVTILPTNNPPLVTVTVPSTNPVNATPNPGPAPVTVPSTTPVNSPPPFTNPITTPSTTPPVTNPVTTQPPPTTSVPATTPVTNPVGSPVTGGSPAMPGQSWCVARSGVPASTLQAALDYACGTGRTDCSAIQQGASCYNPNTLQNHASYAFNSFYQKNLVKTSCDFGGSAMVTTANPSTGTCIYPTAGSPSSSSPPTATNPTPMTASSGGSVPGSAATPPVLNSSNPASVGGTAGFGETPPIFNSSTSASVGLRPFVDFTILAASIVVGRLNLVM